MIWNPTEGIDLGFFIIRYYSLMFVVAFGLGWYIMKHIYQREGESLDKLDTLFIWTVVATLLGARLGHVFFYDWEYFRNHPSEILLPFKFDNGFEFTGFRGLASHGAAISIIIAIYYYSKKVIHRPMLWMLDRVVIPVTCGAVFVRLGNFFNSEIVGKVTDAEYGIKFIRDFYSAADVVRLTKINDVNEAYSAIVTKPEFAQLLANVPYKYPAQLYEAFCYVFVFFFLFYLYWKTKTAEKHGLIFGYFLVLLWSVRFVVEYVKGEQGGLEETFGLLSTGQWLSIPFVLVGLFYVFMAEKPIKTE